MEGQVHPRHRAQPPTRGACWRDRPTAHRAEPADTGDALEERRVLDELEPKHATEASVRATAERIRLIDRTGAAGPGPVTSTGAPPDRRSDMSMLQFDENAARHF